MFVVLWEKGDEEYFRVMVKISDIVTVEEFPQGEVWATLASGKTFRLVHSVMEIFNLIGDCNATIQTPIVENPQDALHRGERSGEDGQLSLFGAGWV